jgi:hypothetical protein
MGALGNPAEVILDSQPPAFRARLSSQEPAPASGRTKGFIMSFGQGKAPGRVEPVVALRADKATGTDDDPPTPSHPITTSDSPKAAPPASSDSTTVSPMTMSQRREAFFLNRPLTSSTSSSSTYSYYSSSPSTFSHPVPSVRKKDPLLVKIVEGTGVQRPTVIPEPPLPTSFERVLYTRLEREGIQLD